MSKTLLIVDDNPDFLETLTSLAEGHGWDVTALDSAELALQAVHEQSPDVLLTDVHMHPMTGIDLAHEIRMSYRSGPVIVGMSGDFVPDAVENVAPGLFDDTIAKPVADELFARLTDLVQQKKQVA